jgi:hypothetical protein
VAYLAKGLTISHPGVAGVLNRQARARGLKKAEPYPE